MLTADQPRSLWCLADMMIPANAEYAVPSAGDDVIFADILRSFGREAEHVLAVLRTLYEMAGGVFADLEPARREAVATRLLKSGSESLMYLSRIILQCYYCDKTNGRNGSAAIRP
jgi:hypothetical protein